MTGQTRYPDEVRQDSSMNEPDSGELNAIFSDEHIVVVDKPAGLPTLPDGYDKNAPHLLQVLAPRFGKLWIAHRLDRGTSGVMVVARNAEAHRALNIQFDGREVKKAYHALVAGEPPWEEYTVKLPLRANGDRKHRTVVDHGKGKPAVTHLRVLERCGPYSLVEARPETGRTHQIRAHLASLRLPVLGDLLYGGVAATEDAPIERTALHAQSLAFRHPVNEQPLSFEAPYPADFARALRTLRGRK
jgi:tRNA pseudouridine32 synthase / 23S rRNA pseudouridine746 synthase